jgi:hypothetical protein
MKFPLLLRACLSLITDAENQIEEGPNLVIGSRC